MFLYTHAYPAYRHIEDVELVEDSEDEEPEGKKRKITGDNDGTYVLNPEGATESGGDVKDDDADAKPAPNLPALGQIRLMYAKPTPSSDSPKWGAREHIPNASGLFVPYVKDLVIPDKKTLPAVMERYFARCFAKDLSGMVQKLTDLRSAWGNISTTSLGSEMSHIAKCIDLALQAQAIIYPVYTGAVYEGTVISGAGFTIVKNGDVYEPMAYADLQERVVASSAHSRAIEEIVDAVNNEDEFSMKGCSTIRQLSNLLKEEDLDESARSRVVKAAHNLSFENKYWSTSAYYVQSMLSYLVDEKVAIPDDVPMHPKYIFYSSRIEEVMSAFGYEAPSFLIPNGKQLELSKVEPPKNFHVRTLPIATAIGDMMYVLEKGVITNGNQNLSHKHRDLALKSNDKKEVWKLLKGLYGKSGDTKSTESSKVEGLPPPAKDDIDELW